MIGYLHPDFRTEIRSHQEHHRGELSGFSRAYACGTKGFFLSALQRARPYLGSGQEQGANQRYHLQTQKQIRNLENF